MSEQFNPQKILEIAFKVKYNLAKLYEALGQKTINSELRDLWADLEQDNLMYSKVLSEMRDDPEGYVVYELVSGEYDPYLKDIIPSFLYAQEMIEKKTRELFEKDLDAVEFAIYITIKVILVYSTLKDQITPLKLDIFNKIVGDEKKHLSKLNLVKKKLME
ncbi:MAG: hypothetical protein K9L86_06335 [Candidatus Omnitrophica bacterium]|nr:hypothetical protein [Candidatus Omnitrophota bacterium]